MRKVSLLSGSQQDWAKAAAQRSFQTSEASDFIIQAAAGREQPRGQLTGASSTMRQPVVRRVPKQLGIQDGSDS